MPVIQPPDPVWTGAGNRAAWILPYRHYRIYHTLVGVLDATVSELEVQPYPTEYAPAQVVGTGGNGRTIRAGYPTATWYFPQLTLGQFDQILTPWHYAERQNAGRLYIITRTDVLVSYTHPTSGHQELRYNAPIFYAYVRDLTYETGPGVVKQVQVNFGHLEIAVS